MPEFYVIFAPKNYQNAQIFIIFFQKINKIPEFYNTFLPENAGIFFMIIA